MGKTICKDLQKCPRFFFMVPLLGEIPNFEYLGRYYYEA
jgi:hypothetical protein